MPKFILVYFAKFYFFQHFKANKSKLTVLALNFLQEKQLVNINNKQSKVPF